MAEFLALFNQSSFESGNVLTGLTPDKLLYTDSSGSLASATTGTGLVFLGGLLVLDSPYVRSLIAAGPGISYDNTTGIITNTGVTQITGTSNQVITSAATGNITLSLPQDINTTSSPTFVNITGTLTTSSQPNIVTLASVTSLNSIPISANTLGNSSTSLITGALQITTSPAAGRVLTSDASGNGTWQVPTGGVTSITGTANQVIVGGTPTVPVLSTPQDIGTSSNVQFNNVTAATALNGTANFNGSAVQLVLKNNSTGTGALEEAQVLNSANLGVRIGVTSPLYTGWTGDVYIYNSNNAGMMFGTNNTANMYLTAAGNLGVGSFTKATAPTTRLHVKSNGMTAIIEGTDHTYFGWYPRTFATGRKAYMGFGGAGTTNFSLMNEDTGYLSLGTNGGVERLRLATNGQIQTSSDSIELGQMGTGDRNSYIDFHSSGAPYTIDYSARLLRQPGVNGLLQLAQTGTGGIYFDATGSGFYQFGAISGGNCYSYAINSTNSGEDIRIAAGHRMMNYVDTSGFAITGTSSNTAHRIRTSNVDRMIHIGNTYETQFLATTYNSHLNYGANEDAYIRAGKSTGVLNIGDTPCNGINLGNTTHALNLSGANVKWKGTPITPQQYKQSGLYSIGVTVDYPHSLGAIPQLTYVYIKCIITDQGYAVDDEVQVCNYYGPSDSVNTTYANATNVGFRCNNRIVISHKTSGAAAAVTLARWGMYFRCWYNIP